ncbi:MAG: YgeY family selenium metabolism-linked hydrolase, partial [Anaerolineae bacterium]
TDRMGSVVGRIGAGEGKKLLYNAHLDTVGIGDPSAWPRDPYGAVIEGGILYGRGACDMKGALAAMVYGGKLLLDAGVILKGDLYVAGVVQEEGCEGLAMRVLVEEEGIRPDFVVLGEATNLQVSRGQRGRMEMRVTVRGRACHASAPERGENAIYPLARIALEIEGLNEKLAFDPFLGKGSIAATVIESTSGGVNVIPDSCTLYLDRRLTAGESEARAVAEVREIVARHAPDAEVTVLDYEATSYAGYPCRAKQYFPSWVLAEDHPLVQAASRAVKEALGYEPLIGKWAFSTDGAYTMGVASIPTVGFGPGEECFAHTVEDQVRIEDVVKAARVYAQLAVELLGVVEEYTRK